MPEPKTFSVLADYNQFFLLDDIAQPQYPEIISESAIEQRIQVVPNLLAIYTASASVVSVSVVVCDAEPAVESESWLHIVSGSIAAPSGRLALAGCTDYLPSCPRIAVPTGECRFVLCGRGFAEGEHEQYFLHFWPGSQTQPKVLKRYVASHG